MGYNHSIRKISTIDRCWLMVDDIKYFYWHPISTQVKQCCAMLNIVQLNRRLQNNTLCCLIMFMWQSQIGFALFVHNYRLSNMWLSSIVILSIQIHQFYYWISSTWIFSKIKTLKEEITSFRANYQKLIIHFKKTNQKITTKFLFYFFLSIISLEVFDTNLNFIKKAIK